jgi:hypothetical protein
MKRVCVLNTNPDTKAILHESFLYLICLGREKLGTLHHKEGILVPNHYFKPLLVYKKTYMKTSEKRITDYNKYIGPIFLILDEEACHSRYFTGVFTAPVLKSDSRSLLALLP